MDILLAQRVFYHQHPSFVCQFLVYTLPYCFFDLFLVQPDQWLLVMLTQLIGFTIGGICKCILVALPSMIWPDNLITVALLNALHTLMYSFPQWYFPPALLCICFHWLLLLQSASPSWKSLP